MRCHLAGGLEYIVKCALPTRWSAALDQPVSNLAVAAELPWIWIPRTISPDYHDQVVACYRAAGFAPDARHTARRGVAGSGRRSQRRPTGVLPAAISLL